MVQHVLRDMQVGKAYLDLGRAYQSVGPQFRDKAQAALQKAQDVVEALRKSAKVISSACLYWHSEVAGATKNNISYDWGMLRRSMHAGSGRC